MVDEKMSEDEVTALLKAYDEGDKLAYDKLFNLVYDQLKKVAHNIKFHNADYQTLNTTALVHEAYLKMLGSASSSWKSRKHFYSLSAKAIRQILIDEARKKLALKRIPDEDAHTTPFELPEKTAYDIEALELAMRKLEDRYSNVSKVIEFRFYAGMTIKETSEVLGMSPATVKRNWAMGKMWLYHEIKRMGGSASQIQF